jgi:hypothetical protein
MTILVICIVNCFRSGSLVGRTLFRVKCCKQKRILQKSESSSRRYSHADTIASEIESTMDDSKRQSVVSYGLEIQIKDEYDNKPLATITELNTDKNRNSRPSSDNFDNAQIVLPEHTSASIKNETRETNVSFYMENDSKTSDDVDPAMNRRSTEIILKESSNGVTFTKLSCCSPASILCEDVLTRFVVRNDAYFEHCRSYCLQTCSWSISLYV